VDFSSILHRLPEDTEEKELIELLDKLNRDPRIKGFLCTAVTKACG